MEESENRTPAWQPSEPETAVPQPPVQEPSVPQPSGQGNFVPPPGQAPVIPQPQVVEKIVYLPYGMTPETYKEKKSVRKTANTIAISLLITEVVFLFWSVAFFFAAGVLGFDVQTTYRFIIDPAVQQGLQIGLSTVGFLIPALILFKAREKSISDLAALSRPEKGTVAPMFMIGMAFCMFANVAVSICSQFFSNFGIDYHTPATKYPGGVFGFCLSFLATCVFPAFIEEFVFRGLLMGSLRKFGDGFAIFVSAILFGLAHGNFEQIPFAFLVGIVLGFLVTQTGSLWVGIAVHAANNFVSFFFTTFLKGLPNDLTNLIYVLLLMVLMALGIVALLKTGKREGGFSMKKAQMQATEKEKYKWFFFSPFLLILIGVCLFNAFSSFVEGMS